LIGLGLLVGRGLRGILLLLYVQMLGTLTPIVLFPDEVFIRIPYVPTLEGQYIIKNLVLISAGIVVGATVRGGRIVPDPKGRVDSLRETELDSTDTPARRSQPLSYAGRNEPSNVPADPEICHATGRSYDNKPRGRRA
jgi:hypothetical protein